MHAYALHLAAHMVLVHAFFYANIPYVTKGHEYALWNTYGLNDYLSAAGFKHKRNDASSVKSGCVVIGNPGDGYDTHLHTQHSRNSHTHVCTRVHSKVTLGMKAGYVVIGDPGDGTHQLRPKKRRRYDNHTYIHTPTRFTRIRVTVMYFSFRYFAHTCVGVGGGLVTCHNAARKEVPVGDEMVSGINAVWCPPPK